MRNPIIGKAELQAVELLLNGFSVIPIKKNEKRPAIKSWRNYQTTPAKPSELPFHGNDLALICGFNDVEVIDIDTKHDKTIAKRFGNKIRSKFSSIPKTVIQRTRSGGYHLIYRCKEIEGNRKLALNKSKEAIIETRGIGGYILISPSSGYKVERGSLASIPEISISDRNLLFACAESLNEHRPPEWKTLLQPLNQPKKPTAEKNKHLADPFADYCQKTRCENILMGIGWQIVGQDARRIYVKRDGRTDTKFSGNILKDKNIFYCHSSSTDFDTNRGYNPVQLYSAIYHNGDLRQTSLDLFNQGFGRGRKC